MLFRSLWYVGPVIVVAGICLALNNCRSIAAPGEALSEKNASAPSDETPKEDMGVAPHTEAEMKWFRDSKFGMFLHWGLYAVPGKGEWYMENAAVTPEEYKKYAYDQGDGVYFDAKDFDAKKIMEIAKKAGMKYVCLTSRHHDGFALFDSKHPNAFTSVQTIKRDLLREYVDACRSSGLKLGVYYSPIDWRYPGYYDVTGTNCAPNKWNYKTDPAHKENARLMKEELYEQVRTLFRDYGPFDYVFWDGSWLAQKGSDRDGAFFWEPGKYLDPKNEWPVGKEYQDFDETGKPLGVMGIARKYSPQVICNGRSGWIGDVDAREGGAMDLGPISSAKPWERCLNFNRTTWGFNEKQNCMSYGALVEHFVNCLVRDGNMLLNFGPDRHGVIPPKHVEVISKFGDWLENVGQGVYGTRAGPWNPLDGQYGFTKKPGAVFVFLLPGYKGDSFLTKPIPQKVSSCKDLLTKQALRFKQEADGGVKIEGIDRKKHPECTAIGIYFSESDR